MAAAGVAMTAWAGLVVLAPQGLITEAAERAPRRRNQVIGIACLAAAGVAALLVTPSPSLTVRMALSATLVCILALAYIDARLFVIPDVYSVALAAIGLVGPLKSGLSTALWGAAVGGGLVWGVRLVWRRMAASEGLGFGDVKLAAALGCLLGPSVILRAICVAAIVGAALGLVLRSRRAGPDAGPEPEPQLIPFGAGLGLSGLGFLYWSWLP